MPERLTVSTKHREGLAKTCEVTLGNKQFLTPGFAIRLDSQEKLKLYLSVKQRGQTRHLAGYVVHLTDAQRVLGRRLRDINQIDLQGRTVDKEFLRSSLSDLVIIDPALEHLYYGAHLADFAVSPNMPKELVDYALDYDSAKRTLGASVPDNKNKPLRTWLNERHLKFWSRLEKDERARTRFIRDMLVRQLDFGATMMVPPVPLITNSSQLFELAKIINRKSFEVSRLVGECAEAFTFQIGTVRNSTLMNELKEVVSSDHSNSRLTVLKFKYMNLNEEERIIERTAFRNLMQELDMISRLNPNRIFMLLESGNQTLVCAGRGFDFLSTSFSVDRDDRMRRTERSPWSKWFDGKYQTLLSRDDLLIAWRNNGNRIPDDCRECVSVSDPESLSMDEWNKSTKRHYLFRRNKDFGEVASAILEGTATAGMINKLSDSVLKNLVELVR